MGLPGLALCAAMGAARAQDDDAFCQGEPEIYVRAAQFGRDIGATGLCTPDEHDGCSFAEAGVSYGVGPWGGVSSKEILAANYRGRMPFGLRWGDTLKAAQRKVQSITRGKPSFTVHTGYDSHNKILGTNGYCILTKKGDAFYLDFAFDENDKLVRIKASLLWP